jgi:hypothetical protein
MKSLFTTAASLATLLAVLPQSALAYIGPGAGVSAIGTVIALVGAVLLAILGFVWYPIKRLRSKPKKNKEEETEEPAGS